MEFIGLSVYIEPRLPAQALQVVASMLQGAELRDKPGGRGGQGDRFSLEEGQRVEGDRAACSSGH